MRKLCKVVAVLLMFPVTSSSMYAANPLQAELIPACYALSASKFMRIAVAHFGAAGYQLQQGSLQSADKKGEFLNEFLFTKEFKQARAAISVAALEKKDQDLIRLKQPEYKFTQPISIELGVFPDPLTEVGTIKQSLAQMKQLYQDVLPKLQTYHRACD